jgi:predicted amidohydrolase YtcJ
VSLDGALGSYGAWLLQPYADRAGWTGLNTFDIDSLKSIAAWCWKHKVQLCVHAIGDKANREAIDIFAVQIQQDPKRDHRWRVEHAQHVNPFEIPRFAKYKVIASMQSVHCTSDAPYVSRRLGEERASNGAYRWRDFMNAGVVVTNGTDAPVEDVNPIPCLFAAVTRKPANNPAFYPDQVMTRAEALYSYTMANAYAAFQEKEKGSIEVGKWADMILLDQNLLQCSNDDLLKANVLYTWVGGKQCFKK